MAQAAAVTAWRPSRVDRTPGMQAALVSAALFGANALSYLLNMIAARALAPDVYGALGSLLAVVVVGAVPAMGMQTVAALRVADAVRLGRGTVGVERQLLRTGLFGGGAVGAVAALAAPALVALLHLPSVWPALWLGLALAPLTLLGVFHGVLQGGQRFGALAALVGVEGVLKVGGALAGLVLFRSTAATLAGMAAGCAVTALAGWWMCGRRTPARSARWQGHGQRQEPGGQEPGGQGLGGQGLGREVVHATQAILGLVLLVNLDIVLARHHLPGAAAGDYAVGVIITKIAYWLPQAVAVIVLPRFVDPRHRRRLVPVALGVIALLDAWVVLATAVAGGTVLQVIGGASYGSHVGAAWLFALIGSLLALVQLLLYSRIASADRWSATAVWAAVLVEIALVTLWLDDSVTSVASAALASVGMLVIAGLAIEYAARRTSGPGVTPRRV